MSQPVREGPPRGFTLKTTSHQRHDDSLARRTEAEENIVALRDSVKNLIDPVQVAAHAEAVTRYRQKEFKRVGLLTNARESRFPSDNTPNSPWFALRFKDVGKGELGIEPTALTVVHKDIGFYKQLDILNPPVTSRTRTVQLV